MEFILQTDLSLLPQTIDFNFEDMKSEISAKLERYNALVVTEDSIKSAKEDKASLNKLKTAVDDYRKKVKKQYLAPYEVFEKQCKEIVGMIDKPVVAIDNQVKAFDEIEKTNKYASLQQYFNDNSAELFELIELDDILNPKWANKSEKLIDLTQQIYDRLDKIRADLKTISDLKSPYGGLMQGIYLKTFDISKCLTESRKQEELDKKLAEIKVKKQSENTTECVKTIEPPIISTRTPLKSPEPVREAKQPIENENAVESVSTPLYSVSFSVTGTKEQILALREFMKNNNIKFGKVGE